MDELSNIKRFKAHFEEQLTKYGQDLILEFFLTFSRFECALKNSITYATSRGNRVEPNWDLFASDIESSFQFEDDILLSEAVSYILTNPPKRQQLRDGKILWEDRVFLESITDINRLCLSIRAIRNNLMHGGKFQGRYEPDISRNYKLINYCLIVLNEWLNLHDDINRLFHERIN